MALITPEQLTAFMQRGALDASAANLACDLASGAIITECGWGLLAETEVEMLAGGDGSTVAFLPTAYITTVHQIDADGLTLIDGTDYQWSQDGVLERLSGVWSAVPRSIVALVDHGYPTLPETPLGIALAVATRCYDNPNAERVRMVGSVSSTFWSSGSELTDGERRRLARGGYTLR